MDARIPIEARLWRRKITLVAALLAASSGAVFALTTVTTTFNATINIQATCIVATPTLLDFGSPGVLSAPVTAQQTSVDVTCTFGTLYNIGLNAGTGAGATVAVRKMTSPATNTVNYSLYSDGGHTTVWGNTIGTNTVSDTANGQSQGHQVFGLVPPQTTPAPAVYTDTITVTVSY
jgi:spore coat protein U-like protein